VSFADPFAKSYYENVLPDEVLVSKELKVKKHQACAKGRGHVLIPFIIGIGAGWV